MSILGKRGREAPCSGLHLLANVVLSSSSQVDVVSKSANLEEKAVLIAGKLRKWISENGTATEQSVSTFRVKIADPELQNDMKVFLTYVRDQFKKCNVEGLDYECITSPGLFLALQKSFCWNANVLRGGDLDLEHASVADKFVEVFLDLVTFYEGSGPLAGNARSLKELLIRFHGVASAFSAVHKRLVERITEVDKPIRQMLADTLRSMEAKLDRGTKLEAYMARKLDHIRSIVDPLARADAHLVSTEVHNPRRMKCLPCSCGHPGSMWGICKLCWTFDMGIPYARKYAVSREDLIAARLYFNKYIVPEGAAWFSEPVAVKETRESWVSARRTVLLHDIRDADRLEFGNLFYTFMESGECLKRLALHAMPWADAMREKGKLFAEIFSYELNQSAKQHKLSMVTFVGLVSSATTILLDMLKSTEPEAADDVRKDAYLERGKDVQAFFSTCKLETRDYEEYIGNVVDASMFVWEAVDYVVAQYRKRVFNELDKKSIPNGGRNLLSRKGMYIHDACALISSLRGQVLNAYTEGYNVDLIPPRQFVMGSFLSVLFQNDLVLSQTLPATFNAYPYYLLKMATRARRIVTIAFCLRVVNHGLGKRNPDRAKRCLEAVLECALGNFKDLPTGVFTEEGGVYGLILTVVTSFTQDKAFLTSIKRNLLTNSLMYSETEKMVTRVLSYVPTSDGTNYYHDTHMMWKVCQGPYGNEKGAIIAPELSCMAFYIWNLWKSVNAFCRINFHLYESLYHRIIRMHAACCRPCIQEVDEEGKLPVGFRFMSVQDVLRRCSQLCSDVPRKKLDGCRVGDKHILTFVGNHPSVVELEDTKASKALAVRRYAFLYPSKCYDPLPVGYRLMRIDEAQTPFWKDMLSNGLVPCGVNARLDGGKVIQTVDGLIISTQTDRNDPSINGFLVVANF